MHGGHLQLAKRPSHDAQGRKQQIFGTLGSTSVTHSLRKRWETMEASWNIKHAALPLRFAKFSYLLPTCSKQYPVVTAWAAGVVPGRRPIPKQRVHFGAAFWRFWRFWLGKRQKLQTRPRFWPQMRFYHLYPIFPFFWGLWHSQAPFGWRDCWACLVAWKEGFQKKGSCTGRIWAAFDGLQSHWPTESWCKATACSEFCL